MTILSLASEHVHGHHGLCCLHTVINLLHNSPVKVTVRTYALRLTSTCITITYGAMEFTDVFFRMSPDMVTIP